MPINPDSDQIAALAAIAGSDADQPLASPSAGARSVGRYSLAVQSGEDRG
jgi:hypothetical protein